jgi:hypothetical protein
VSLNGARPSVIVIGDLCLDHNEVAGRVLEPSWGSPALFIARQLQQEYGLRALVSGPHGEDLLPFLGGIACDREPSGQRSLSYKNLAEPAPPGDDEAAAAPGRVQHWRPADRPLQPISPKTNWAAFDLVYFCPLVPDEDRVADIEEFRAARQDGHAVHVLVAQGLMRVSGEPSGDHYRRVERRDITDAEAATWSCFDIVVFSDEDQSDALAKATRWSAHGGAAGTGFVVTQGRRGATLCFQGRVIPVPTLPVTDETTSVGAGDAFAATMGLEFYQAYVVEAMSRSEALHRATVSATAAASARVLAGVAASTGAQ